MNVKIIKIYRLSTLTNEKKMFMINKKQIIRLLNFGTIIQSSH